MQLKQVKLEVFVFSQKFVLILSLLQGKVLGSDGFDRSLSVCLKISDLGGSVDQSGHDVLDFLSVFGKVGLRLFSLERDESVHVLLEFRVSHEALENVVARGEVAHAAVHGLFEGGCGERLGLGPFLLE